MHCFVRKLLTEWRKLGLPFRDQNIVVAISGGADSVALALALEDLKKRKKLDLRFVLAHFDHSLRGEESARDAESVKNLAQRFDFELAYKKGVVPKEGNLEQNARFARYDYLLDTARNLHAFGILTAHTINDQAETFLLNLIRGSGPDGLSAMKPVISDFRSQISDSRFQSEIRNPRSDIALVRPLLSWAKRRDTENYCHFREIDFRFDSMNEDLNFTRVRIRKILLPMLREYNPKIVETLARTAKLLQTEREVLSKTGFRKPETESRFLHLKDLRTLSKVELYSTLRQWLAANRGGLRQIELKHIEAIERLIYSRKSGRVAELPNGQIVLKEKGKLFWKKKNIENIE